MTKPKTPKTPAKPAAAAATPAVSKRIVPDITGISTAVEMPTRANNRGSKSLYPFDEMPVGGSFGVTNKSAANMASIISNQNRKHTAEVKDAEGNAVFKTQELKGADGTITKVPTNEVETERTKHFFAQDCDPVKDPDGATVRVFRNL